jgi:hypothetical protein
MTIRLADGTPNGDTGSQPIATVYNRSNGQLIAAAPELFAALNSIYYLAEKGLEQLESAANDGVPGAQAAYDKADRVVEAVLIAFGDAIDLWGDSPVEAEKKDPEQRTGQ